MGVGTIDFDELGGNEKWFEFRAQTILLFLAEKEGFEPPVLLQTTVFKTAALDHSAISPGAKVLLF